MPYPCGIGISPEIKRLLSKLYFIGKVRYTSSAHEDILYGKVSITVKQGCLTSYLFNLHRPTIQNNHLFVTSTGATSNRQTQQAATTDQT